MALQPPGSVQKEDRSSLQPRGGSWRSSIACGAAHVEQVQTANIEEWQRKRVKRTDSSTRSSGEIGGRKGGWRGRGKVF